METVRIATRQSALALWQANHIKQLLEQSHPGLACEIVGMTTTGDRNKTSPLSELGGKGVFVKELETALLEGSAEIAVHSMKDVPGELPEGLAISAMVARAHPGDAMVSNSADTLAALPTGSKVGSSSLRRVLQLKRAYPELKFADLRGNVDTRLRKLDEGNYDAIILAVAGLSRLGLADRVRQEIDAVVCIPAAGQGAIGIESRADRTEVADLVAAIDHSPTSVCVSAERKVTQLLGATCELPVAVFAEIKGDEIGIRAFISDVEGREVIREEVSGSAGDAMDLAGELGELLLSKGARRLISEAGH